MIGYLRVSTTDQAEAGHGLDAQRAAILAEASHRRWATLDWVEDTASGKSLDRPGLRYALDRLASGSADGIAVARLDRLSRSVLDFASLHTQARAQGWNVAVLDLGLDLTTPYGEFAATTLMAAAQLERQLIAARTRDALAAARAKGIRPGPRPAELPAETLAAITDLRAFGASLTKIAFELTQAGVPLPSGRPGCWHATQVRRALARS